MQDADMWKKKCRVKHETLEKMRPQWSNTSIYNSACLHSKTMGKQHNGIQKRVLCEWPLMIVTPLLNL